jgi:hypothetical protein
MRRLAAALAAVCALAASPAPTPEPIRVRDVRAPSMPHCFAEDQWVDPMANSPINLLDGDPESAWTLCTEAAEMQDYTVRVRFAAPVAVDLVRLVIPPDTSGRMRPQRVEIALHDSALSDRLPIYFRELAIAPDRAFHDVGLTGKLSWNPSLINDVAFHARRRARRLDEFEIQKPLRTDGITLVFRKMGAGDRPPRIAELALQLGGRNLPVADVELARRNHAAYIEQGLRQVLEGNYLVSFRRVVGFGPDGTLWTITPDAFRGGAGMPSDGPPIVGDEAAVTSTVVAPPRRAGRWRIEGGRLLMGREGGGAAVGYRVDRAPDEVKLLDGPFAGTWNAAAQPPGRPGNAPPPRVGGLLDLGAPAGEGEDDAPDFEIP